MPQVGAGRSPAGSMKTGSSNSATQRSGCATAIRSGRSSRSNFCGQPCTMSCVTLGKLEIDIAHARDEREHGGNELHELHGSHHLLQPDAELFEVRRVRRGRGLLHRQRVRRVASANRSARR
jgi:hypothetical protein